ncbi:MAG: CAP domain-containing protein [Flavobacteriaceae bacterium]
MKTGVQLLPCLFMVFVLGSCSKEVLPETETGGVESIVEMEQEVLSLVNEYRAEKGMGALQFSEVAYKHASDHNDYMVSKGKLSHDNFSARASKISISANAQHVGENVAKDYYSAEDVLQAWVNSPNHNKTLTDTFTHTAISVKKNTEGTLYFTQLFYR